jgi:archaellum component FlaF (FlaF/FlaG flagellin family)
MKFRGCKKRLAVAEIMGTLIMIAITLIAGAAVFGWIDGQAGSSENAYGQSVANNVNFLKESFTAVATQVLGCSGGTCNTLNLTLYNRGEVLLNVSSIAIATLPGASPAWSLLFEASSHTVSVPLGSCSVPAIAPNQKTADNLLSVSTLSYPPYQVKIPSSVACPGAPWGNGMVIGQSYIVTIQGFYGNTLQTQVRAVG